MYTYIHTQYAVKGRLDESYAPFIRKPRTNSSSSGWNSGGSSGATGGGGGGGITTTSVRQRWNWIPTQRSRTGGAESKEVRVQFSFHYSGPSVDGCTM